MMIWALILACTDKGEDSAGDDNAALLEEVETAINGYSSWDQIKAWPGIEKSDGTHGTYNQVWYNDVAVAAIDAADGADMPAGAGIVKESYTDIKGADKVSTSVMYKDADFGWFWIQYSADGAVELSGSPSGCTDCHSGGQDMNLIASW